MLAWLPGHVAKQRQSPRAEAINVAGWIGILLFPLWMLALIAAFAHPRSGEGAAIVISQNEAQQLDASLKGISTRIAHLETGLRDLVSRKPSTGSAGLRP